MMWGIKVEWDDHGLECCAWLHVEVYSEDIAVFRTESAALLFIEEIPPMPEADAYDRILTPLEMDE